MSEPTRLRARRKMMDMFARRDHSEREVRKKLKEKFRKEPDVEEAIEDAIEYAKENRWLGEPSDLAQRMADMLHRKNKGIQYINNFLKEKGLPTVAIDREQELQKALHLVRTKYPDVEKFDRDEKGRVARFLAARGFDGETVRSIIYDELE